MVDRKSAVEKTGYEDIDELFHITHKLLQEGDQLKKAISEANEFKPYNPFSSSRTGSKWKFKLVSR